MPEKIGRPDAPALLQDADRLAAGLPAFAGIDVALGLDQVGGQPPMLLRVLKKFRDNQGASFEDQFRAAMASGQWVAAFRIAHSLKGVSRTLGASELADSTQQLETVVESRDASAIAAQLKVVLAHLRTVTAGLAGLETWMEAAPAGDANKLTPDTLAELHKLGELLDTRDTQALEWALLVTEHMKSHVRASEWAAICDAIENYEFTKAADALRPLLKELQMEVATAQTEPAA